MGSGTTAMREGSGPLLSSVPGWADFRIQVIPELSLIKNVIDEIS
jgi:hypothetical protein